MVVRVAPLEEALENLAELAVLAAVDHPGLARLIDHGSLARGTGSYVMRTWVEGRDLLAWSAGRDPGEIGRLVARVCPALEHLHRRGFVHGDLKATNVIVREGPNGPEPVLTDFGLARETGAAPEVIGGTLFHAAPEVLLGGALTPAVDLFALGVMLHQLLLGRRASAREFYGRFPGEDFFAASGTRSEELPAWAREVVAALLARDPTRRPESAERLGRTLAGRLGLAGLFASETERLAWPALAGRETWLESWWRSLRGAIEGGEPASGLFWLRLDPAEDPRPVMEALALHAALGGAAVVRLDLARELSSAASSAAIDAWSGDLLDRHAGHVLFAAPQPTDPWQLRGVATLAHAVGLRSARHAKSSLSLVVVSAGEPIEKDLEWRRSSLPAPTPADVERFLESRLAASGDPSGHLAAFAALVHESGHGTSVGIDCALSAAAEQGWFLSGEERPRLRPGSLPAQLAPSRDERSTPELLGDAARLWAALHAAGSRASLAELALDLDASERSLAAALEPLVRDGLARVVREGARSQLAAARGPGEGWGRMVSELDWRGLHRRRAARLEREGAGIARSLPHRFAAGDLELAELLETARTMIEEGLAELALDLVGAIEGLARARGESVPPELRAERAFAWCSLGQSARALSEIEPLRGREEARIRALVERVDGKVAALRHEHARAQQHFEAAQELDQDDGGETLLAQAQHLFEARRYDAAEGLVARLSADEREVRRLLPRVRNNLRAIEAMSLFRRGEIAAARERLAAQVAEAREQGHAPREASLLINLATVERRAGDLEAALESFDRAIASFDAAGNLAGLAQARALSGGALREAGHLREAETRLASALAIRERLGDRVGARAVRGMLGLALADRGRVRSALEELARSGFELRESGRSHDALLLESRAYEMRARLALPGPGGTGAAPVETERAAEGDPRTLIALARAAWLTDDPRRAAELCSRAAALAATLGLGAAREEAGFLAGALEDRFERSPGEISADAAEPSLTAQDRALCALLAAAPLDAPALLTLAESLERAGRDDRAARAWIAFCVRAGAGPGAASAAARAEELLASCAAGASVSELERLERTLLGFPDPWPEDLVAWRQRTLDTEGLEMEVIELLDINHRLLAQEDLKSLLGAIVEQALSVSGAQRGFLVLAQNGELVVDTALDSRRGGIDESEVELSGSALRQALESMRPVRVSNAVDDPLLGAAPSVIALELRSILCVPFQVDKTLRGVVYVDHRLREAAFDERAERMLRLLADQAALAILQVRRLEEIRRLNRELGKQVVAVESDLKTARKALLEAGLPVTAGGLVGDTPVMREVRHLLERAAPSKLSVLVRGESGTGKELAARALHELSPWSSGPFVSENCAALPPSLIEAELFGARRGAYTGADRDREGLFERAHGGTLFLDEVGELPFDLQAKLLRVLETSEVRRLGDERARKVDFRLVVATNRDLEADVQAGRFRADLYYRLKGLEIHMPPLSRRSEDIPALVDHFLRLREREDGVRRAIAKPVLARLVRRPWPGNVRELANEIARLSLFSEGDLMDPRLVSEPAAIAPGPLHAGAGLKTLVQLEREAIESALALTGGDKTETARRLGISRAKIYQRLKEWGQEGAD